MKYIIYPRKHILIKYFPELCNENKTIKEFKNEFYLKIEEINKICKNFYNINCYKGQHLIWRSPLNTGFFLKDIITNKKVIHIGCKYQELDVGFLKYCKNLIGIEITNVFLRDDLKNNINYKLIISDYKKIIHNFNADVYIFWCGIYNDINILNDLIFNKKKKGIFLMGTPSENTSNGMDIFYQNFRKWYNFNKKSIDLKLDYIPILFDESHIKITKPHTWFNVGKNNNWNYWKTYDNMKGIITFLKITVI